MKTKIQIKSFIGNLLFEFEKEDNSIKNTLVEAVKKEADLRGAYLRGADLRGADLRGAYLQGAYLRGADLRGADLRGAYLRGAYLRGAYLQEADLRGAYLQGAYLRGADLQGAKIDNWESIKQFYWIIPEEGSFVAWKKLSDSCIAKIEIPADAKRTCNLNNPRKCRAEFCRVLEIRNAKGNKVKASFNCTYSDMRLKYVVGEIIKPDSYDDSIFMDCSHGIHFFITKQEAIDWNG